MGIGESVINHIFGEKKGEKRIKGKKKNDYYFLWPVDSFHSSKVKEAAEKNHGYLNY